MTTIQIHLCERLKQLGFSQNSQIKLYGSQFELVGDPLVISDDVVFVDALERKSGQSCRVRIPLNIVRMAIEQVPQTHAA
jgi:Fe2+ transport system protein FeoA